MVYYTYTEDTNNVRYAWLALLIIVLIVLLIFFIRRRKAARLHKQQSQQVNGYNGDPEANVNGGNYPGAQMQQQDPNQGQYVNSNFQTGGDYNAYNSNQTSYAQQDQQQSSGYVRPSVPPPSASTGATSDGTPSQDVKHTGNTLPPYTEEATPNKDAGHYNADGSYASAITPDQALESAEEARTEATSNGDTAANKDSTATADEITYQAPSVPPPSHPRA